MIRIPEEIRNRDRPTDPLTTFDCAKVVKEIMAENFPCLEKTNLADFRN